MSLAQRGRVITSMTTSRQLNSRKRIPPKGRASARPIPSPSSPSNQITTPTAYDARVLKLRLPEQNELKNESERCSADLTRLESIGRALGQQVRIKRKDDVRFVALYTVKQANPDAGQSSADVVRAGKTSRARLGTTATIDATVQAQIVDIAPEPDAPDDARFFEVTKHCGEQTYFIAIAPHGGQIEPRTDEQAVEAAEELIADDFPASWWICKGFGDASKGAHDRWHITSTDIQPACFPKLRAISSRRFCDGVAFHGFQRRKNDADLYIGGAAPRPLKRAIKRLLNDLALPIEVKISTNEDSPKFQGFSPENLINRLATRGIHLEQSFEARKFYREIARAVARAFRSRLWLVICILLEALEKKRAVARDQLVEELRRDLGAGPIIVEHAIEREKAWRAQDRALTTTIKLFEELETRS